MARFSERRRLNRKTLNGLFNSCSFATPDVLLYNTRPGWAKNVASLKICWFDKCEGGGSRLNKTIVEWIDL